MAKMTKVTKLTKMVKENDKNAKMTKQHIFNRWITLNKVFKLSKVFYPCWSCQGRSLGCAFAGWWTGTV